MSAQTDMIAKVKDYLMSLQDSICEALEKIDGVASFSREVITNDQKGFSRPRVIDDGQYIERAAVLFSYSVGEALPKMASERNPKLAGMGFEAVSISMISHPRNPYAPTFHANLRFFQVNQDHWHFGGGFDLTPYYPYAEDVLHWHRIAKEACEPFGDDLYPKFKTWCDEYFYLTHRQEPRGVGGLFFDDWNKGGFKGSFDLTRSIGDHILPAYCPILEKRKMQPYSEREREFQLYRRGRYAEFNLSIDRGTKYGLESGRRIESVLASMPPIAIWKYNWHPEPGSRESLLYDEYLKPRDWLRELA